MSLLEMSLSGAMMISVIAVIRALAVNRLPKKTFLALWGITLMRLLVPYSVPSACSVYSLLGRVLSPAETGPLRAGAAAVQPASLPVPGTGPVPSASAAPAASLTVPPYRLVWMAGVLVCAAFFARSYLKCRREFREALPVDCGFAQDWLKEHRLCRTIRLRQSDRISAPLTYGVFCPVILLPKNINREDETALAYVLAHEYIHIRRFDAVTKIVLAAALCIHWFNPAVWVMYVLANRDLELSCDEAVIRLFGERTKSAYAMTLIHMEEKRSGRLPCATIHFSRHAMEERIIAIMKIKKTSLAAVIAAMALVAGVAAAFATSRQAAAQGAVAGSASTTETTVQESSPEQTAVADRTIASADFHEPTRDELLAAYGEFGISFDASGKMLYQNKPVRWFADFVELEEGALATRYVYRNDEGTEYIHTVRNRIDNGDGSYDPFGPLLEIVPWESGERDDFGFLFQGSQNNETAEAIGNDHADGDTNAKTTTAEAIGNDSAANDTNAKTFSEIFEKYSAFGIEYVEAENASGAGNIYYHGQLVNGFADISPDGGAFTFHSADGGAIDVQTIYDADGNLTGVEQKN